MLKSTHLKTIIIVALLGVFLALLVASAAAAYPITPSRDITASKLIDILYDVANWIFTILVVVAVIFGLMAAYQYITAMGDPEDLFKAKMNTLYAMVSIGIGLLAFSVPRIVSDIVGIRIF